jgi:hypothetical protein
MKHPFDARVTAAAGSAFQRLGSIRKHPMANSRAGYATPWDGAAAAKERRQAGHSSTLRRNSTVTNESSVRS